MATVAPNEPGAFVLYRVPFSVYRILRDEPTNRHLRMNDFDGTLEIRSPLFEHEWPAWRLGILIYEVTSAYDIPSVAAASTTFYKPGEDRRKGVGKEPDQAFYLANAVRILEDGRVDVGISPPPDLWIEVDHRGSSRGRLPVYARLGVAEVWRYRVKSKKVWFGRLREGRYEAMDRSLSLPILSPALVRDALTMGEGLSDLDWTLQLRDWPQNLTRHASP